MFSKTGGAEFVQSLSKSSDHIVWQREDNYCSEARASLLADSVQAYIV